MFLLLISATVPNGAVADSYLDHSGKMEFKIDRIQQTEEERQRKKEDEKKIQKEENDLFKPRIDKQIKEIQAKDEKEMDALEDSLFSDQQVASSAPDGKELLFESTYKVKAVAVEKQSEQEKKTGTTIFTGIIVGVVFLLCSTVYFVIKKNEI